MLNRPECITCVLDDLVAAARSSGMCENEIFSLVREAMAGLATTFGPGDLPSYAITDVHRLLKRKLGESVLFRERRRLANMVCREVEAGLAQEVRDMDPDSRLAALARWAVAGNSMDFRTVGTGYEFGPEDVRRFLEEYVSRPLLIDDTPDLIASARPGAKVVYIMDNVGEIAFDTLLVSELRARGCTVTAVVKSGAITSDAVMEDAVLVGLDSAANEVITSGGETLGTSNREMSAEFRSRLREADIVISKGQANFYAMTDPIDGIAADIFCLFTMKCGYAAAHLGLKCKGPVAVRLARHSA
ncbi:MAG: ARMT1-like domain-containing protein [Firmicutes bacterium]|nr:ARMT1-like domain-containing protein [Bacillota bacterium]